MSQKWKIKATLTSTYITMHLFTHTMRTNSRRGNTFGNDTFLSYPNSNFVYLSRRCISCMLLSYAMTLSQDFDYVKIESPGQIIL